MKYTLEIDEKYYSEFAEIVAYKCYNGCTKNSCFDCPVHHWIDALYEVKKQAGGFEKKKA